MNKQQLARKIWASANKLRSKIDANEYKDYILGLIFYKFLSDTMVKMLKEDFGLEDEDLEFVYEDANDPDMVNMIHECQRRKGFFIEYKYLFGTWLKTGDFDVAILSDALKSFERLMSPDYESVYKGIFTTLSTGLTKLGENPNAQTRALKDLINLIRDIPTDGKEDYDVLGYIYEYLIGNFAASAGKKAGEFYTPHEIAMVMSEIVAEHHKNRHELTIYDPTSGSGSLLITIGKAVSKHFEDKDVVKYYAQELKENTYNLTRMNLVMRGILPQNIVTRCADSLEEDWPMQEEDADITKPLRVDAVVSNPPYSQHWNNSDMEYDERFKEFGVAPKTKADYAFLLHELHHLEKDGIMTIVLPHGVLFRGKAPRLYDETGVELDPELREETEGEGKIRAQLIEKNRIDAIIGLPAGIFFGTGIPTLIMVLKKNRGDEGVLFIDASKGFIKDGKQNRLRACDVKRIADTYRDRLTIPGYSREVSRSEIRRNQYNLNIPRYVDSSENAEQYDIYATMFGGIPETEIDGLNRYWEIFPSLRSQLFVKDGEKPYCSLAVEEISATIANNTDVINFKTHFEEAFSTFREMMKIRLIDHVEDVSEMAETDHISDDIMHRCEGFPLVDPYAVYQILSDHWPDIMNDIEIIQAEGYRACNEIETNYKIVRKNEEEFEVPDGLRGRIIPFDLVQRTYLADELNTFLTLQAKLSSIENELAEIPERLDEEAQETILNDDNTKLDAKGIGRAFSDICDEYGIQGTKKKKEEDFMKRKFNEGSFEETLQRILTLQANAGSLKKEIKKAEMELEDETIAAIKGLTMKQIIEMLRLKWIEPIASAIDAFPDTIIATLTDEVKRLAGKYAVTYTDIENDLQSSRSELAKLVSELTGDDYAIEGLNALINSKS